MCPGGALPAGFTLVVSVFCVNPPPVHDGCWPPGSFPPLFEQLVSVVWDVIFANAILFVATVAADPIAATIAAIVNIVFPYRK